MLELGDEHTKCSICFNEFSADRGSTDPEILKRLPVLSSSKRCDHWFCHGCILQQQLRLTEENNGRVPKRIRCFHCKEKTSFNPAEPKYHRLLIDFLGRAQTYAATRAKVEGKVESVNEMSNDAITIDDGLGRERDMKRPKLMTPSPAGAGELKPAVPTSGEEPSTTTATAAAAQSNRPGITSSSSEHHPSISYENSRLEDLFEKENVNYAIAESFLSTNAKIIMNWKTDLPVFMSRWERQLKESEYSHDQRKSAIGIIHRIGYDLKGRGAAFEAAMKITKANAEGRPARTLNPPIIQLLNKKVFDADDFATLVGILQADPASASLTGSHNRSTIWVCCQQSSCYWRRAVALPLLVQYGANVDERAGNGFTPLLSCFVAWSENMEHKRIAAWILVNVCGATIPNVDAHGNPINIRAWLAGAPKQCGND